MSGAGNDFIVLEAGLLRGVSPAAAARRLCARKDGIGADGLLVLGRIPVLRADYFNADGSRAFCGNGSRCAAWWMHRKRWAGKNFSFESGAGRITAAVTGRERVRIGMPDARVLRRSLRLRAAGRRLCVFDIDTGAPHAVLSVPARGLERFPVFEAGRALRRHTAFQPHGANVDFVALAGKSCRVRTYERGVEAETGACGTGAVAAAIFVAEHRGRGPLPENRRVAVAVRVRSGELLRVGLTSSGAGLYREISLEGSARIIFTGEVRL